jgi:uncharacterized membrane protein
VKPRSLIQANLATGQLDTVFSETTRRAPAEAGSASSPTPHRALAGWTLAGILFLALGLRFLHLGSWSFWIDEAWTIIDARSMTLTSKSYPLFYALERASFEMFGVSHTSARLVPALVGAVSCALLYPWFRRFAGFPGSWVATLLLAVSPWHIYWSQTARHYVLVLLLQTVALYFFYVGIVDDKPRRIALSAVLALTAFFTHFSAAAFLGVAAAFLAWRSWSSRTSGGLRRAHVIPLGVLLVVFGGFFLFWFIPRLQRSPSWGDTPFELVFKLAFFLTPAVVALAVVGLFLAWREDRERAVFLGLAVGVPFLFVEILSPLKDANVRYLFGTLPAYLALAAIPVTALWRNLHASRIPLVAAAAMALIAPSLEEDYVYFTSGAGNREPWNTALSFARSRLGEGEEILGVDRALLFYLIGPTRATRADMHKPTIDAAELERGVPVWILVRRRVVAESLRQAADGKRHGDDNSNDRFDESWLAAHAVLVREFPAEFGLKDRTVQVYYYHPPGKSTA